MAVENQLTPYDQIVVAIDELWKRLEPFFSYFENTDSASQATPPDWHFSSEAEELSARLVIACKRLSLSPTERDIVLLCAAIEIMPELGWYCAKFHSSLGRGEHLDHVSPGMIAAIFGQAGGQALDPTFVLRKWQLVQIGRGRYSHSLVQIDRSLLHYLMGHCYEDALFSGSLKKITPEPVRPIPTSYQAAITQINDYWRGSLTGLHPIQLCEQDLGTQQALSQLICPELSLYSLSALAIPIVDSERYDYSLRWKRQAFIGRCALLLDCHEVSIDDRDRLMAIAQFTAEAETPMILLSQTRLKLPNSLFTLEIPSLTANEQKSLWYFHLTASEAVNISEAVDLPETDQLSRGLSELVAQFNLSASAISTVIRRTQLTEPSISSTSQAASAPVPDQLRVLWESCRLQSRAQLEGLAKRVEPRVTWDDLVLPEETADSLWQIISQVRQRATVYDAWQMGGRARRGLGITVMFHGVSGTGKTTASELIARELNLDMYRVDLSAITSKYIGETEKNLSKIFTAAEAAGAILQFDEADAIVGKRGEVSDARDRYANMEVSYLLQRMEAYPGLAILTTNLPDALDAAFLRRIRFSVKFVYPAYKERLQIWERVYQNNSVPVIDLDSKRLATIDLTGAMIRNVALGAAFLAADDGSGVTMAHMVRSLKEEYRKQNRNLTAKDMNILLSERAIHR